jgi:hypothetical protein
LVGVRATNIFQSLRFANSSTLADLELKDYEKFIKDMKEGHV